MSVPDSQASGSHETETLCAHCAPMRSCQPQADLHSLLANRRILETDYGWDPISMISEAKRQYHKSLSNRCPSLPEVKQAARALSPEVDFDKIE